MFCSNCGNQLPERALFVKSVENQEWKRVSVTV